MERESIADLFCGAGGSSLGFEDHFDVSLAVDFDPNACRTYRKNLSGVVREKDVRDISGVRGDFKGIVGVIGGTPCKPFSRINTRKKADDPRIDIWKDFMRIVEEVKPQFFMIENVPTIFAYVKEGILREAKRLGYIVNSQVLNTADYGVPQARSRWIVVGSRKPFAFPQPTVSRHFTVREAFAQIKNNYGFQNRRPETSAKFKNVTKDVWVAISDGKFKNAIRLKLDRPSPTIVNIGKVYMIHPTENRTISLAEAAVCQDFPGEFEFTGTMTSQYEQVANAAPRSFMSTIAEKIQLSQFA